MRSLETVDLELIFRVHSHAESPFMIRPAVLKPSDIGRCFIEKHDETLRRKRYGSQEFDGWGTSGGVNGSKVLGPAAPSSSPERTDGVSFRRRYGKIKTVHLEANLRFYVYRKMDELGVECGPLLFHVLESSIAAK